MKKLLTLVALLSFGVLFVGCGESTPPKTDTPAPTVDKGAAAPAGDKKEDMPPADEGKAAAEGAPADDKPAGDAPAEDKKPE